MPLQPLARYSGSAFAAGQAVVLQILVLNPGALADFQRPDPLSDLANSALGYPMLYVLQDPTIRPGPSPINDICSTANSTVVLWGKTRDNPCLGGICPNDDTPCYIYCGNNDGINSFVGSSPAFDESDGTGPCTSTATDGCVRYANPSTAGTHYFASYQQSLRDLDDDGIENALDTCPATPSSNPRSSSPNDTDADGIDNITGCDTTHVVGDTDEDNDGFDNRQDNCPRVANADQKESEALTPYATAAPRGGPRTDNIGDACESNDTVANGHFHTVFRLIPKCIGATDSDGDGFWQCRRDRDGLEHSEQRADA